MMDLCKAPLSLTINIFYLSKSSKQGKDTIKVIRATLHLCISIEKETEETKCLKKALGKHGKSKEKHNYVEKAFEKGNVFDEKNQQLQPTINN